MLRGKESTFECQLKVPISRGVLCLRAFLSPRPQFQVLWGKRAQIVTRGKCYPFRVQVGMLRIDVPRQGTFLAGRQTPPMAPPQPRPPPPPPPRSSTHLVEEVQFGVLPFDVPGQGRLLAGRQAPPLGVTMASVHVLLCKRDNCLLN